MKFQQHYLPTPLHKRPVEGVWLTPCDSLPLDDHLWKTSRHRWPGGRGPGHPRLRWRRRQLVVGSHPQQLSKDRHPAVVTQVDLQKQTHVKWMYSHIFETHLKSIYISQHSTYAVSAPHVHTPSGEVICKMDVRDTYKKNIYTHKMPTFNKNIVIKAII